MQIGITGNAGSGKGTVARQLASSLGYYYVDVGMIFRSIASVVESEMITEVETMKKFLEDNNIRYCWDGQSSSISILGGNDTVNLHSANISSVTSHLASKKEWMILLHSFSDQIISTRKNVIADGRNIGTTIMKNADFVFFISVDIKVRAERRHRQLVTMYPELRNEDVLDEIVSRDNKDACRSFAPYIIPVNAINVSNSAEDITLCISEIIAKITD